MSVKEVADLALRMSETVDLSKPAEIESFNKTGFNLVGETFIGVRLVPAEQMAHIAANTLELGPKGIQQALPQETVLGVTFSGTPHHVRHMFGYWHINDVDEVQIWQYGKTPEDPATVILLMRAPRPGERDMFAWYCENCMTLLYCEAYDSGRIREGWEGFLGAERQAIRTFNADRNLRICKECSQEHPMGYGFWSPYNDPEEEKARPLW